MTDEALIEKRRENMAKARAARAEKISRAREEVAAEASRVREADSETSRSAADRRTRWNDFVYTPSEEEARLHIDRALIPDGMDWQWITSSVYGQPQPQRLAMFQKQGWEPVRGEDLLGGPFDGKFLPKGWRGQIEVDGLILHERPMEFTLRARKYELDKARSQVAIREQSLRQGNIPNVTFDTQHPSAQRVNIVNRSYERLNIPEE